MSDETNEPAGPPGDEPADTRPSLSGWATPPADSDATPEDAPPADAAASEPEGEDEAEPSSDEPTSTPEADEAESADGEPTDREPAATDADDGSDEPEPAGDDGSDSAESEADGDDAVPEAETGDAAADADTDDDAAAQRAALEAELDKQLAALDVREDDDVEADDVEDDDIEHDQEDDEPLTPADEADALLDRITPTDADDAVTEQLPTEPQPVVPGPAAAPERPDELASIADAVVLAEAKSRGPVVPLVVIGVLIAIVIGIVVAVGGGDDDEPSDAAPGASTTVSAPAVTAAPATGSVAMPAAEALGYFQAYGTQSPDQLRRMIDLAAEGTPARYYAVHQQTLAEIDPQRNAPLTVTVSGERITACPQDPATGGCVDYEGFQKDGAGRITEFTINGTPLRERIAIGNGSATIAGGMRISIISRYVSVSGRIFIAYFVHNDGTTPIEPVSVRYIEPGGDTVEPDNDTFRSPVAPGTSIVAAAAFPTTEAGGTLAVVSTSDSGNSRQSAQLSTP